MSREGEWNTVRSAQSGEPRETVGDTQTQPKRRAQRPTENAKGEGRVPQGPEDQASQGEEAGTPRSTSQQERPGQNEDQAEKTEGPEGGEDTGTREGVVPGGGETPQNGRTTGGNRRGSRPDREQQGPPPRRGVARPKTKNKKSVPSRVFSSVASVGEHTGQERRFHGCLSTVVNSIFGEEVSRSELYHKMRSSK